MKENPLVYCLIDPNGCIFNRFVEYNVNVECKRLKVAPSSNEAFNANIAGLVASWANGIESANQFCARFEHLHTRLSRR